MTLPVILARSQAVTYSSYRHKIHPNYADNGIALCTVVSVREGLTDLITIL